MISKFQTVQYLPSAQGLSFQKLLEGGVRGNSKRALIQALPKHPPLHPSTRPAHDQYQAQAYLPLGRQTTDKLPRGVISGSDDYHDENKARCWESDWKASQ